MADLEMSNEEAIERILDHMVVHKMAEKRAIKITKALQMAMKALKEQPKWNFFGVQKMTEEEREQYGINDYDKDNAIMLSGCPENGQEVIVYNGVEMFIDTFIVDHGGCYFERTECYIGEGWAWMPAPKPPKGGEHE